MVSLYDVSISQFIKGFESFVHILEKGQEHCKANNTPTSEFFAARLAPDMLGMDKQVQIASNTAKKSIERLTGKTLAAIDDDESTYEQLIGRAKKTLELLNDVKPEDVNGKEAEIVNMQAGKLSFEITAKDYALGYALSNFFFHLNMAYALLRSKGVVIGKMDYLGPFVKDYQKA